MSMAASAIALEPEFPSTVANWPDAAMEVSMFPTLIADNAEQPSHVLLKTPVKMLDGFQLVNTSAEKSVKAVLFCHAPEKFAPLLRFAFPKVTKLVQLYQASEKLVPF